MLIILNQYFPIVRIQKIGGISQEKVNIFQQKLKTYQLFLISLMNRIQKLKIFYN